LSSGRLFDRCRGSGHILTAGPPAWRAAAARFRPVRSARASSEPSGNVIAASRSRAAVWTPSRCAVASTFGAGGCSAFQICVLRSASSTASFSALGRYSSEHSLLRPGPLRVLGKLHRSCSRARGVRAIRVRLPAAPRLGLRGGYRLPLAHAAFAQSAPRARRGPASIRRSARRTAPVAAPIA
jgi:hypothetical protein